MSTGMTGLPDEMAELQEWLSEQAQQESQEEEGEEADRHLACSLQQLLGAVAPPDDNDATTECPSAPLRVDDNDDFGQADGEVAEGQTDSSSLIHRRILTSSS